MKPRSGNKRTAQFRVFNYFCSSPLPHMKEEGAKRLFPSSFEIILQLTPAT